MRQTTLFALVVCASLEGASAQTSFVVQLDSAQQVPTNSSAATGSGRLTLNANNTLSYDISYTNLVADFQAAHIHGPAGPGTNAGVLFPLINVPTNTRSGALRGTTPALDAGQISSLTNGLLYANIHTMDFADGEIRGQLLLSDPFDPENWPLTVDPRLVRPHRTTRAWPFASPITMTRRWWA